MKTARLFTTGRSKAIRLPKAWIGDTTEVEMEHRGDEIIVRPKRTDLWKVAEECRQLGSTSIERLQQTTTGIRADF